jgi:hypothetical protein
MVPNLVKCTLLSVSRSILWFRPTDSSLEVAEMNRNDQFQCRSADTRLIINDARTVVVAPETLALPGYRNASRRTIELQLHNSIQRAPMCRRYFYLDSGLGLRDMNATACQHAVMHDPAGNCRQH